MEVAIGSQGVGLTVMIFQVNRLILENLNCYQYCILNMQSVEPYEYYSVADLGGGCSPPNLKKIFLKNIFEYNVAQAFEAPLNCKHYCAIIRACLTYQLGPVLKVDFDRFPSLLTDTLVINRLAQSHSHTESLRVIHKLTTPC